MFPFLPPRHFHSRSERWQCRLRKTTFGEEILRRVTSCVLQTYKLNSESNFPSFKVNFHASLCLKSLRKILWFFVSRGSKDKGIRKPKNNVCQNLTFPSRLDIDIHRIWRIFYDDNEIWCRIDSFRWRKCDSPMKFDSSDSSMREILQLWSEFDVCQMFPTFLWWFQIRNLEGRRRVVEVLMYLDSVSVQK